MRVLNILLVISYRTLLFFPFARLVAALGVRCDACLFERELVPITPGTQIPPTLVDLQDQFVNLQDQVNEAVPGSPGFDDLVNRLDTVQASLEVGIQGVAVLVNSAQLPATFTPSTSSTDSSIMLPPSFSTNSMSIIPVVTTAATLGTPTFVLTSEGGSTSTVTLTTSPALASDTSAMSSSPASVFSYLTHKKTPHGFSSTTAATASPRKTHGKQSAKQMAGSGSMPFLPGQMKIRILCTVIGTIVFSNLPVL